MPMEYKPTALALFQRTRAHGWLFNMTVQEQYPHPLDVTL